MLVDDLILLLRSTADTAAFANESKLLLICVNKTVRDPNLTLYDAVRYSWTISRDKARDARYVLAVAFGLIVGVFVAEEWLCANKANFPDISEEHGNWRNQQGRSGFRGHEAPESIQRLYCGKRVPDEHKPGQIGFHYVNF